MSIPSTNNNISSSSSTSTSTSFQSCSSSSITTTNIDTNRHTQMSKGQGIYTSCKKNEKYYKKKNNCQIIIIRSLSISAIFFIFLSILLFFLIFIIQNNTTLIYDDQQHHFINGLKYDYYEICENENSGLIGTIYLESNRLIDKNYEIIKKNNDNSLIYIYNDIGVLNNENEGKRIFEKYDCVGYCECKEIRKEIKKKMWKKKEIEVKIIQVPVYNTLIEKKGDDPLKQIQWMMGQQCRDLKRNNINGDENEEYEYEYECKYNNNDGLSECVKRVEANKMWACVGVCVVTFYDGVVEIPIPVDDKHIFVTSDSGSMANHIAETVYFPKMCENAVPFTDDLPQIKIKSCCTLYDTEKKKAYIPNSSGECPL